MWVDTLPNSIYLSIYLSIYIYKYIYINEKIKFTCSTDSMSLYTSFKNAFSNFMKLNYNSTDVRPFSWKFCGTSNSNSKYQNQAFLNFGTSILILISSVVYPPHLFLLPFPKKIRIYNVNFLF